MLFIIIIFIADVMSMGKTMVKELLGAFPGIDEAMSFAEVMRYVKNLFFIVQKHFCQISFKICRYLPSYPAGLREAL